MQLFGPVLFYDLLRMSRRGRYILLRCLYVILLLALVWWVYQAHFGYRAAHTPNDPRLWMEGGARVNYEASAQQIARFAEHFFGVFMAVQFLLIVIVTPASTAGAIAEEKQRKTLEYILATDLANREIVFGKLIARLGNLTLFLLAGLPVISLMLFLGGIDPVLLWAGFAATLLTMFSIASLSIMNSVLAKRPRDAIVRTYLMIAAYPAGLVVLLMLRGVMSLDPPAPRVVLNSMDLLLNAYNSGNPFWGLYKLVEQVETTGSMGDLPAWLLLYYVAFHLLISGLCLLLAVSRVRASYLRQTFGRERRRKRKHRGGAGARPGGIVARPESSKGVSSDEYTRPSKTAGVPPDLEAIPLLELVAHETASEPVMARVVESEPKKPKRRVRPRPPIGERPMVWKERYVERGFRLGMLGEGAFALLGMACLFPGLVLVGVVILDSLSSGGSVEQFQVGMRTYTRIMGTVVACILLIGIGIRAAGSIGSEREKQTFDGLLASLLTNREILWAKWLGSVLALRWVYYTLALIWFLAAATLSLHWSSFVLSLLALAAYVCFMASLGLYFAVASKTGLRAVSMFALTCLLLAIGPWLVASIWLEKGPSPPQRSGYGNTYPGLRLPGHEFPLEHIVRGLSPPHVLQRFAYHAHDLETDEDPVRVRMMMFQNPSWQMDRENRFVSEIICCLPGVALYGLGAVLLWLAAESKFRKTCGRVRTLPLRLKPPVHKQESLARV